MYLWSLGISCLPPCSRYSWSKGYTLGAAPVRANFLSSSSINWGGGSRVRIVRDSWEKSIVNVKYLVKVIEEGLGESRIKNVFFGWSNPKKNPNPKLQFHAKIKGFLDFYKNVQKGLLWRRLPFKVHQKPKKPKALLGFSGRCGFLGLDP